MVTGFNGLPVKEALINKLKERGIGEPTAIQLETIPLITDGRDVVARSQTGTGKTLAFLLPIFRKIDTANKNVQAMIIVPTQELGMQIFHECEAFADVTGIRAQPLIGGAALSRQVEKLKLRPQIIVGTPGRLLELVKMKKLSLGEVKTVVIDEVDQVFALSSVSDVEQLLRKTGTRRQLLFFSATVPEQIREKANRWMKSPEWIQIAPQHRAAETLEHLFVTCEERDKIDTVRRLVRMLEPASAILFINDTEEAAEIEAKLKHAGLEIEPIYGDAAKQDRSRVMQGFRSGRFQLLLATDVAARGLDLPNVTHVFNLDLPFDVDHYVHRAGRTGRMGRHGTVISLAEPKQLFIIEKFAKSLGVPILERTMYEGKLQAPEDMLRRGNRGRSTVQPRAADKTEEFRAAVQPRTAVRTEEVRAAVQPRTAVRTEEVRAAGTLPARAGENGRLPEKQSVNHAVSRAKAPGRKAEGQKKPAAGAVKNTPAQAPTAAKQKERERDRKNKGAPRWLKEKAKKDNGTNKD